jgi:DHA1 family inner membrane transport protein
LPLAAATTVASVTVVLLFLFGVAFFALNPLLGARIIGLVPGGGPTLALSVNICAVQLAIAFAGWFGALVLDAGFDPRAVMLGAAALAALGLSVSYLDLRRERLTATARPLDG